MKKVLIIFLSIILFIQPVSIFATMVTNTQPFSDTENHWAKETINKHYQMGMLKGYPDDTFKPDQTMIRSELITLINRYFGLKEESDSNFEDVSEKEWYSDDAAKAKYYEYVADLKLNPKETATREDVINMLSIIIDVDEQEVKEKELGFNDLDEVDNETKGNIEKFSQLGYISGYKDGSFKPKGTITRAEIITIFENSLGYIVRIQEDIDNMPDDVKKVTIINPNIIIENKEIHGDIYLSPGAKSNIIIKNTKVNGKIEISGGNIDEPLVLENVETEKLVITKSKEKIKLKIKGKSVIKELKTKSDNIIELSGETKIKELNTLTKTELKLIDKSVVTSLTTKGETDIQTETESEIKRIEAKAKTNIIGKGKIGRAYIKDKEVTIESKPLYTKIDRNIGKVTISGKKVSSRNDDYNKNSNSSKPSQDKTVPIVSDGIIKVSNEKPNSIDITWTKSADDTTPTSELEYLVYYSTDNNLDTISNIEANGTNVGIYKADINTKTITELTESTIYYFNIIVKDKIGNKSAYIAINGTTTKSEVLPALEGSGTVEDPYKIYTIEDLEQIGLGTSSHYKILNDLDFKNPASYRIGVVNIEYTDADKKGWIPIKGSISEKEKYEQFKKSIIVLYTWQSDPKEYLPSELTLEVEKLIKKLNENAINNDSSRKEIFDVAKISIDIYYEMGYLDEMGNMDNIDDVYNLSDQEVIDLSIENDIADIEVDIPFTGSIDGNNHTISNLMINRKEKYQGLIGITDSNAVIKNLALINCDIKSKSNSGSLIGDAQNTSIINCKVKDIIIMTCESDDPYETEDYYGGLVGSFDEGLISNCSVDNISIQGDSNDIGGLVGNNGESEISNCNVSNVNIKGEGGIGGLVGKNYGTIDKCTVNVVRLETSGKSIGGFAGYCCSSITNSSVDNLIIKSSESYEVGGFIGSYSGNDYFGNKIENCDTTNINIAVNQKVGGFVGTTENANGCLFTNNHASGTIRGTTMAGGFAGKFGNNDNDIILQKINTCYSDCNVLPTVDDNGNTKDWGCRGGFIAQLINANISKCYSLGELQSINGQIGSFVGEMVLSSISNSYATGSVTGKSTVGGFVGKTNQTVTIENCYTTGKVSGYSDVGGFVASSGDSTYSSKNILTISNCIAFNKDGITGDTNSHINRFASHNDATHTDYLKEIIYNDNYGYKDMIIKANGEIITGTSNAQSLWGSDITTDNFKTETFYTDSNNWYTEEDVDHLWDFTEVWQIKDGADRPTLIGVGDDDGK